VSDPRNLPTTFLDRIRTFHHSDFHPEALVCAKRLLGATVSVCIPAHNEESTVGAVVSTVRRGLVEDNQLVDEVVVLDDRSKDGTAAIAAAAGAIVIPIAEVLPEIINPPGKGNVLWRSLHVTSSDIVCWIDADIADFRAEMVTGILGPLLHMSHLGFVKGYYARPTDGDVGGGRVTELVAKPLIASLFPQLVGVRQPLAGATAARRELLKTLPFQAGWGVELGLLLDVARIYGVDVIAQTDLGELRHRNKPLKKLIPQASAVIDVGLARYGIPNEVLAPPLLSVGTGGTARSLVELPPIEDLEPSSSANGWSTAWRSRPSAIAAGSAQP
jgi:glucosyl-3-phosphoglycerate synthase